MTEQYIGWALVVGVVLGGGLVWFVVGRLPRRSDDVGPDERRREAEWIAGVIESRGGVAPPALVDEVLELHTEYLDGPPLELRPGYRPRRPRADVEPDERVDASVRAPLRPPAERLRSELADEDRHAV